MDLDGDGYAQHNGVGGDCDDTDAGINPGAQERCTDIDYNCDGASYDGFRAGDENASGHVFVDASCMVGQGACARQGVPTCDASGLWLNCVGVAWDPSLEIPTNGIDDDCDGETDEIDAACHQILNAPNEYADADVEACLKDARAYLSEDGKRPETTFTMLDPETGIMTVNLEKLHPKKSPTKADDWEHPAHDYSAESKLNLALRFHTSLHFRKAWYQYLSGVRVSAIFRLRSLQPGSEVRPCRRSPWR